MNANNCGNSDADVESAFSYESLGAQEMPRFNSPVRLKFRHYRHRFADPDGLSVKAFIDGLVKAQILADDSAKEIKSIEHEQIKIPRKEPEKTSVEIELA